MKRIVRGTTGDWFKYCEISAALGFLKFNFAREAHAKYDSDIEREAAFDYALDEVVGSLPASWHRRVPGNGGDWSVERTLLWFRIKQMEKTK